MGPVGLLGGHRQPTWRLGRLVAGTARPAKHAGALPATGLVISGQRLLGLLAASSSPFELAAAVAGGLVELAQPVALGPQLTRGELPQVWAGGGVDGQG